MDNDIYDIFPVPYGEIIYLPIAAMELALVIS